MLCSKIQGRPCCLGLSAQVCSAKQVGGGACSGSQCACALPPHNLDGGPLAQSCLTSRSLTTGIRDVGLSTQKAGLFYPQRPSWADVMRLTTVPFPPERWDRLLDAYYVQGLVTCGENLLPSEAVDLSPASMALLIKPFTIISPVC